MLRAESGHDLPSPEIKTPDEEYMAFPATAPVQLIVRTESH
jgi:hypothetical protein